MNLRSKKFLTPYMIILCIPILDDNMWRKGAPPSTNINSGNLYDYYEILEEIGRQVV